MVRVDLPRYPIFPNMDKFDTSAGARIKQVWLSFLPSRSDVIYVTEGSDLEWRNHEYMLYRAFSRVLSA